MNLSVTKIVEYINFISPLKLSPLYTCYDLAYFMPMVLGDADFSNFRSKQRILKLADHDMMLLEQEYSFIRSGFYQRGKKPMPSMDIPDGTPLMYAAADGRADSVKPLIDKYAGQSDKDGKTALMHAAANGHDECVNLLIPKEAGIFGKKRTNALLCAFYNGHQKCVDLLITAEGSSQNDEGFTTLMHLCSIPSNKIDARAADSRTELIKKLIPLSAGKRNMFNNTALIYAAKNGYIEWVKLLLPHEANITGGNRQTALMSLFPATRRLHDAPLPIRQVRALVELLAPYQAGVKDSFGNTALINICRNDWVGEVYEEADIAECVKLLIDKEAGMKGTNSWTALHYAIEKRMLIIASLLVEKEGTVKNGNDIKPLSMAIEHDMDGLIEALIANENDTSYLKDMLKYAVNNGLFHFVPWLMKKLPNLTISSLLKQFSLSKDVKPFIKFGSFIDVLNRAAKTPSINYEQAMAGITAILRRKSHEVLIAYNRLSLDQLSSDHLSAPLSAPLSELLADFPMYAERIPTAIQEINRDATCCVCLNDTSTLYRNCANCACYACMGCWGKISKCPQCNTDTVRWKECFNFGLIEALALP